MSELEQIPPEYQALKTLYVNGRSLVLRVLELDSGTIRVLKFLNIKHPAHRETSRFRNEFKIASQLKSPGLIRALKFCPWGDSYFILFEHFPGEALSAAAPHPLPVHAFLPMAIACSQTLAALHEEQVVHRDISCSNLLWDPQAQTAGLIDMGLASLLPREQQEWVDPELLQGKLLYMSPEQTGRVNRSMDYRTDIYSLGVVFFKLLTGMYPFPGPDAQEILYGHVARPPVLPQHLLPSIPPMVSQIVLKCLQKNAEDRYQNARGLSHDLQTCWDQLQHRATIPHFSLGQQDVSPRFHLAQRLYGREAQLLTLQAAFDRIRNGGREILLIAGEGGIGKTVLAQELRFEVRKRGAEFLSCDHDQMRRERPYSAIFDAIRPLLAKWQAQPAAQAEHHLQRLRQALSADGAVLRGAIPELDPFLPQDRTPAGLPHDERHLRINRAMTALLLALSDPGSGLVLFIDNLQWSDGATLLLLESLALGGESTHLLVLGAYRHNEIEASHPLRFTRETIQRAQGHLTELLLPPLDKHQITAFLHDSFPATDSAALEGLAEICTHKTGGNPFYLRQWLTELYDTRLLQFSPSGHGWVWDQAAVAASHPAHNVTGLLLERLHRLPPPVQNAVHWCAVYGRTSPIVTIAQLMALDGDPLKDLLEPAARAEIIAFRGTTPETRALEFTHDRLQQAAYQLTDEATRTIRHMQLARHLRGDRAVEQLGDDLFAIAGHFLRIPAEALAPDARLFAVHVLHQTAQRAMQSAAFSVALVHVRAALALLPEPEIRTNPRLWLQIANLAVQVARLCGETEMMFSLGQRVLQQPGPFLARVPVMEELIQHHISSGNIVAGLTLTQEMFAGLGVNLPLRPSLLRTLGEAGVTLLQLGRHPVQRLEHLPLMTDEAMLRVLQVAGRVVSASYIDSPNLFMLIAFRMTRISLRYGQSPWSPWFYTLMGMMLTAAFGAVRRGNELGEMARRISFRPEFKEARARVFFNLNTNVRPFLHPYQATLHDLTLGHSSGLETGDYEYAMHSLAAHVYHIYFMSVPLPEVDRKIELAMNSMAQLDQHLSHSFVAVYRQACHHLQHDTTLAEAFRGPYCDRQRMLPEARAKNNHHPISLYLLLRLQLHILYDQIEPVEQTHSEMAPHLHALRGFAVAPEYHFYQALLPLLIWEQRGTLPRTQRRVFHRNYRLLRPYARHNPHNFGTQLRLLEVLHRTLRGRNEATVTGLNEVLQQARAKQNHQLAALIGRRLAAFWQRHHHPELETYYLNQELRDLEQWGAMGLAEHLRQTYRQKISAAWHPHVDAGGQTLSPTMATSIDYKNILDASLAISQDVRIDKLLCTMMKIIMESAGANRGYTILSHKNALWVEAFVENTAEGTRQEYLQHRPLTQETGLSQIAVQIVGRTHQPLVLGSAAQEEALRGDPHVQRETTRSLLCLPILSTNRLLGLVYLENNLMENAFTQRRLKILQLLSAEVAISLENSYLYRELEQTNKHQEQVIAERTIQLRQANTELLQTNAKIDRLLLNVLPPRMVQTLKDTGTTQGEYFRHVSVLFTDMVGFTRLVSELPTDVVLAELNDIYQHFDEILQRYGGEQIQTMGDGYLAVAGIPHALPHCAANLIEAALEIMDYLHQRNATHSVQWSVRAGIHCGDVSGGVIGATKFAYTIFGNTVNTAARMEQNSLPGRITVSETIAHCLAHRYVFERRPPIEVKGKGILPMYFVGGRRPPDTALSDPACACLLQANQPSHQPTTAPTNVSTP